MFRFALVCCLLVVPYSTLGGHLHSPSGRHLPGIIEKKVGIIQDGAGKIGDTLIKTLDKGRDGILDVQGKIGEVGNKLIQKLDKGTDTIIGVEGKLGEKIGELGDKLIQKFDNEEHTIFVQPPVVQTVIRETVHPFTVEEVVKEIHAQPAVTDVFVQPAFTEAFIQPAFTDVIIQPAVDHAHILQETCAPQTNLLVVTRHSVIPLYDVVTSYYIEPAYQYQVVTTVLSTWTQTQFVETTVSLLPQVSRYTSTIFSPAFTTQVNTIQAIEYELVPVHIVVTERDTTFLVVTQTDIQKVEATNTALIVETVGVPAYFDGNQVADITITNSVFEPVYLATATTTVVLHEAIHYTVTVPEYVTVSNCPINFVTEVAAAGFDLIHDPSYSYYTETHYGAHPGSLQGSFHAHSITEISHHTRTYTKTRYENNTFTDVVYQTVPGVNYATIIPATTVAPGGKHKIKAFLKRVHDLTN